MCILYVLINFFEKMIGSFENDIKRPRGQNDHGAVYRVTVYLSYDAVICADPAELD